MKKEALRRGWVSTEVRVQIDGALSYVVVSPKAIAGLRKADGAEEEIAKKVRAYLVDRLSRLSDRIQGM